MRPTRSDLRNWRFVVGSLQIGQRFTIITLCEMHVLQKWWLHGVAYGSFMKERQMGHASSFPIISKCCAICRFSSSPSTAHAIFFTQRRLSRGIRKGDHKFK